MMSADTPSSPDKDAFLARFRSAEFVALLAARLEWPEPRVRETFEPFFGEIDVGLGIARRELGTGQRVLEVGAGLGLVSFQLRREGHDVTALEPAGEGFDFFRVAAAEVRRAAADIDEVFADRHRGAVTAVHRLLSGSGLLGLLRRLPPSLATPLLATMRKPD